MSDYMQELLVQAEIELRKHWPGEVTIPDLVKRAFLSFPRHEFLPEERRCYAGKDWALATLIDIVLPGGKRYDSTQSQPTMVLEMLLALSLENPVNKSLEIGFGTGWVLAMMSTISEETYGTEVFPHLCEVSRENLKRLGCKAEIRQADFGEVGWPECGPYDRILVSCAFPEQKESELIDQLAPGGVAVAPIAMPGSPPHSANILTIIRKNLDGFTSSIIVSSCTFVDFL